MTRGVATVTGCVCVGIEASSIQSEELDQRSTSQSNDYVTNLVLIDPDLTLYTFSES